MFKNGPVEKRRQLKVDNIFRASFCLKIVGQKKEDDLMFNELTFNFDLTLKFEVKILLQLYTHTDGPMSRQNEVQILHVVVLFLFL